MTKVYHSTESYESAPAQERQPNPNGLSDKKAMSLKTKIMMKVYDNTESYGMYLHERGNIAQTAFRTKRLCLWFTKLWWKSMMTRWWAQMRPDEARWGQMRPDEARWRQMSNQKHPRKGHGISTLEITEAKSTFWSKISKLCKRERCCWELLARVRFWRLSVLPRQYSSFGWKCWNYWGESDMRRYPLPTIILFIEYIFGSTISLLRGRSEF